MRGNATLPCWLRRGVGFLHQTGLDDQNGRRLLSLLRDAHTHNKKKDLHLSYIEMFNREMKILPEFIDTLRLFYKWHGYEREGKLKSKLSQGRPGGHQEITIPL